MSWKVIMLNEIFLVIFIFMIFGDILSEIVLEISWSLMILGDISWSFMWVFVNGWFHFDRIHGRSPKIMKLDHKKSWKMFHLTWFLVINHDQSWFPNSNWERRAHFLVLSWAKNSFWNREVIPPYTNSKWYYSHRFFLVVTYVHTTNASLWTSKIWRSSHTIWL